MELTAARRVEKSKVLRPEVRNSKQVRSMTDSHTRGLTGERAAARYLRRQGYSILAHRWRCGHKEIDLVVRRDELVVFVEVKRRADEYFAPLRSSVPRGKRRNLVEAARGWLARHPPESPDIHYRFDVILLCDSGPGAEPSIEHIEDAFRA